MRTARLWNLLYHGGEVCSLNLERTPVRCPAARDGGERCVPVSPQRTSPDTRDPGARGCATIRSNVGNTPVKKSTTHAPSSYALKLSIVYSLPASSPQSQSPHARVASRGHGRAPPVVLAQRGSALESRTVVCSGRSIVRVRAPTRSLWTLPTHPHSTHVHAHVHAQHVHATCMSLEPYRTGPGVRHVLPSILHLRHHPIEFLAELATLLDRHVHLVERVLQHVVSIVSVHLSQH